MKHYSKHIFILLFFFGQCYFSFSQKVNLSGFIVFLNDKEALLHWNIDSGPTCNGIAILHSTDTINFEEIGSIAGVCGNSSSSTPYNFTHNNPVLNKINYYKIRMGFSQFSEIKSLYISYIAPGQLIIKPNPANELFNIEFNNDKNRSFSIDIINSSGQQVFNKQGIKENNYTLNAASFDAGTYFILLQDEAGRIIKSKFSITK